MSEELQYKKLNGSSYEYLNKYFTHRLRSGYVECRGAVLPEYFQEFGDKILHMGIRPDDVWLCSFPKTGGWKFYYFSKLKIFAKIVCESLVADFTIS